MTLGFPAAPPWRGIFKSLYFPESFRFSSPPFFSRKTSTCIESPAFDWCGILEGCRSDQLFKVIDRNFFLTHESTEMQLSYSCPSCLTPNRTPVELPEVLTCSHCSWSKSLSETELKQDPPGECLICSCRDVWRQKDFPQRLGVAMVGVGALFSTIAWAYYQPLLSIGILLGFALIDLLLYLFMPDVLVCYRCGARYRRSQAMDQVEYFNLETAERYRQEKIRLEQARPPEAQSRGG